MTSWSMCLRMQADKDAQEMIASKSQLRAQEVVIYRLSYR